MRSGDKVKRILMRFATVVVTVLISMTFVLAGNAFAGVPFEKKVVVTPFFNPFFNPFIGFDDDFFFEEEEDDDNFFFRKEFDDDERFFFDDGFERDDD